jgi:hypothetical protein
MFKNKKIIVVIVLIILISLGLFYFLNKSILVPKLTIRSSTPTNNSENVSIFPEIKIEFANEINEQEQKQINIIFSPNVEFTSKWEGNVLTITPNSPLELQTSYNIKISTPQKKPAELTFITTSSQNLNYQDQIKLQTTLDLQYAQATQKNIENRPWLEKFPIDNKKYTLVYDSDLNKIRARIKIKQSNYDGIKSEIENVVLKTGTPTDISIYWIYPN